MTGIKRPKVILLESDDTVRKHAESILTKQGWTVTCEQVSQEALNTLEQSKNSPFALFISNFKLPKMEGDDILQKVKSISPLTQRMLIVPADKADEAISAINKAEINACITSPFKEEDLINQTRSCFRQFVHSLKRQQLKRVTEHQNKQMFKIAQKLKKKDDLFRQLIDEKKAQKLMLKSKKRKIENENLLNTNASLSNLMETKGIEPTPEIFKKEFITVCNIIKDLFDQVATRCKSAPVSLNLEKILNSGKQDAKQSLNGEERPATPELIEKIIKEALNRAVKTGTQRPNKAPEEGKTLTEETSHVLDEYFDISIDENQTKAYIQKIKEFETAAPPDLLNDLLDMLRQKQILYGILENDAFEAWILKPPAEKMVIAQGKDPVYGQNGKIKFQFETDFSNPGKINEDGSIDFRERGDIPYVAKGDLLAEKTLPQEGSPGISISGITLLVDEVLDPVFVAGSGAEISEDGLCIHATIDGQPHLDALGTISVNPELLIPGDVDFETGNIDFKGNIVVKGMIKEGFTVKGINLTAQEVEGATIDLSGDLNVSAGITNSSLTTHGNIYAKFLNHSTVMGFGNLVISKEIIDSNILLSGSCQNSGGHIISSKITAKLGIEAGKIGTSSSIPVKLKVGVDEHVETLKKQIDEALEASVGKSNLLKDEIKKLEDQDQTLYQLISEKAHIQDRAQLDVKALKKSLPEVEKLNDKLKLKQVLNEIRKLIEQAKVAEQELNTIFETQDRIANEIEQIKNKINQLEEKNKTHVIEKKALKEFSKKEAPLAIVTVAKTITQDSSIKGPHSSIILKEDKSRCRIHELASQENGLQFYEMIFSDL